jgi:hypothetical protein
MPMMKYLLDRKHNSIVNLWLDADDVIFIYNWYIRMYISLKSLNLLFTACCMPTQGAGKDSGGLRK